MVKPRGRRRLVRFFVEAFGLSRRRSCRLAGISRSALTYVPSRQGEDELRSRIHHWAKERPRYGYRRIHVLLRREGQRVNRKRVYRIYREERLAVRRKRRKRVSAAPREALAVPNGPNERWSLDFMADTLADGRTFRTLNVVDDGTRECVAIEVGRSIPAERVTRLLERLRFERSDRGVDVALAAADALRDGVLRSAGVLVYPRSDAHPHRRLGLDELSERLAVHHRPVPGRGVELEPHGVRNGPATNAG